jgi:hypothetical protein
MRGLLAAQRIRRRNGPKSLTASKLLPNYFVDDLPVDGLTGEASHDRFHDAADILRRRRSDFGDRFGDGALDNRRVSCRRKVSFEHADLGGFLLSEVLTSAPGKLVDRIFSLLDERGHDLARLVVVDCATAFDLAIHERSLEHTQRAESHRILRAHRIGDCRADFVDERQTGY